MLKKALTFTTIAAALLVSTSSMAAFGKIIRQSEAVEADKIELSWDKKMLSGEAKVTGCEKCPLQFHLDSSVKFYYHGKPVPANKIESYSGKAGAVIYDAKDNHVIKISW